MATVPYYVQKIISEMTSQSWQACLVGGVACYIGLCALLRYRRLNKMRREYNFPDRRSLSMMTVDEAQAIMNADLYLEFPTSYDLSLRLALFRTYAVEGVAKTLVSVSDLNKSEHAPKRYEDTAILYSCFAYFAVETPSFLKSVARMNYLHAPYIKSGKISNEDLLYVLWASMNGPLPFINKYEWRELSDMEVAAIATIWKHVGDLMSLDYAAELGKSSWADGVEFMDDMTEWALRYEDVHMKPLAQARSVAEVLMDMTLKSYPKILRPFGYQAAIALMDKNVRKAFSMPEPNAICAALTHGLLVVRKLAIRYFALPRITPIKPFSGPNPQTGRIQHYQYLREPWYNPSTFWSRWGLEGLVTWASGCYVPGDDPVRFKPEGFLFEDIGSARYIGKGVEEMAGMEDDLRTRSKADCRPFAPTEKA